MSKLERRHFSAQEKVKILRLHLLEGKAVSNLCEPHRIPPSLFYQWQRQFFENGTRAFEPQNPGRSEGQREQQLSVLEQRLQRTQEWLTQPMEAHTREQNE